MKEKLKYISYHKKLVIIFSLILIVATLVVGMLGYYIAKKALNEKGKQLLSNAVDQAVDIIGIEYDHVEDGMESEEEAQSNIKQILLGSLEEDGKRTNENEIDLGQYGYFIIYDSKGNIIMHPTLEGQEGINIADAKDPDRMIVQEQIAIAKDGGGFMEYNWQLPYMQNVQSKMTYGTYFEQWDWIVVATAYIPDFNRSADQILVSLIIVIIIISLIILFIFNLFAKYITEPITKIVKGMEELQKGNYQKVSVKNTEAEIIDLVDGYNSMIYHLEEAYKDIQKKNDEITFLAYHDELTKLLNLYGLENYILNEKRNGIDKGALVLIHLNGLNIINGMIGYDKGNEYIRDIGMFLSGRLNRFYCARTNSNEFALWMTFHEEKEFDESFELLKNDLELFAKLHKYGKSADFYYSVTFWGEHGTDFSDIYEKATIAMKIIKQSKTDTSIIFNDCMKAELAEKFSMTLGLGQAFSDEEIFPYYQEKYDCITKKVIGVEALARWVTKERGIISPAVFIPAIKEQNLTTEFTEYMIDHILRDYDKLCRKYQEKISVSINITPTSFFNSDMVEIMKKALNKYQVPAEKVILEITEDVFISDLEAIDEITRNLHDLGLKISIDDFGTGYSSLKYLAKIKFDELKIDKSFIDQILEDEKVFELVKIFVNIAQVYDYQVVAEGVENKEQLEKLELLGIEIIQGYLFSKPMPLR